MDGVERGQFVLRLSPGRAGYWGRDGGIPSFVTFKERSITNDLGFLWHSLGGKNLIASSKSGILSPAREK